MSTEPEFAGYLPGLDLDSVRWESLNFSGAGKTVEVLVPVLSELQIDELFSRVRTANRKVHKSLSVNTLVTAVSQTIELLLDRHHPLRKKIDDLLPCISGFDPEMSRLAFTGFLKNFRKPQLWRFLAQDFGNPMLLDSFQPVVKGGYSKAMGDELAVHVWAGNVPGLPLWSLISGLLVKSGTIGKVASAEPLVAGWFAKLLVEVEPRLADCLAVVWWRGGDLAAEQAIFQRADTVLAYGGNSALQGIKNQLPPNTRFLPHGHKLSFAVVAKEALDARKSQMTAQLAAFDVMRFDQQGCYSLQMMYVQKGGRASPRDFANFLAQALASYASTYPLRGLDLNELQARSHWLQEQEIQGYAQMSREVSSGPGWAVVYSDQAVALQPSALNRTVQVCAIDHLDQVADLAQAQRPFLQSVGVAASPQTLFSLADNLGLAGVTRISALGQMTTPEAGWHHDGRFSLLDLTRWVDMEVSAQTASEPFAPYAD